MTTEIESVLDCNMFIFHSRVEYVREALCAFLSLASSNSPNALSFPFLVLICLPADSHGYRNSRLSIVL